MTTQNAEADIPYYLAIFGRCEVFHFRNQSAMHAFMRAELLSNGVDLQDCSSVDELEDALITHIHERYEGPVQWGVVVFGPPASGAEDAHAPARSASSDTPPDAAADGNGA